MAPPKGFKPSPASAVGKGRRKGSRNKNILAAREMFLRTAVELGGLPAMVEWARSEPSEFYKLFARLIPVEHTGVDGAPLLPTVIVHELAREPKLLEHG